MKNTALVIVASGLPSESSGGPSGFIYLLAQSLMPQIRGTEFSLYLYSLRTKMLVPLTSQADLQATTTRDQAQARTAASLRRASMLDSLANSPWRPLRNAFTLARKWTYRRQKQAIMQIFPKLLAKHDQVIVHSHDIWASHRILQAAKPFPCVSLIHMEHSKGGGARQQLQLNGEAWSKDAIFSWLDRQYREVFNSARAIVFPSKAACDLFESACGRLQPEIRNKTVAVHSGVDVIPHPAPTFSDARAEAVTLFAVAQHVPEKGIDRMLTALAECKKQGSRFVLRIAGAETPISPSLYAMARQLGVAADVQFLGQVTRADILNEMARADIILACPRVVVFDLSLLEAMAMGKPIVTSSLGGNIEALGEAHPGLFSEDHELPPLLSRLLNSPSLLETMGKASRSRYEREFTLTRMAERYVHLYRNLEAAGLPFAMEAAIAHD